MHKIKLLALCLFATVLNINLVSAQNPICSTCTAGQSNDRLRAITTAVPILTVSPDARSAGMGDAGVAISSDANAAHWNPAKLGFLTKDLSVGLSYSPWLSKLVNDMSLSYLSGAKKINENSAFSASMLYFNLGSIQFTDQAGLAGPDFRPKEYAFSAAYGRKLSENLSMGIGGRYIHSNLAGGVTTGTSTAKAGNSVAADIGIYYTNDMTLGGKNYNLSFGGNVSNIGAKISYTTEDQKDFIPMNLRLGTAFTAELDPYNKLTFALDGNKLLVPSPTGNVDEDLARRQKGVLNAMFSSFSDAPDGFSEEISEINLSTGIEYWYDNIFAARAGYFYEDPDKGNRQYITMGLGLRYQKFGIDAAYLVPTGSEPGGQANPLANTIRFTLHFNLDAAEETTETVPAQ
jgi:hypothetical protein